MVKTIDGSAHAERALEPAAWLSRTFDDDLRIVRSSFSHQLPTTVESLHGSNAAAGVTALARRIDAAPIAVSTHGHSGHSARALGQVATDIVRHSSCPVLVRRIRP